MVLRTGVGSDLRAAERGATRAVVGAQFVAVTRVAGSMTSLPKIHTPVSTTR